MWAMRTKHTRGIAMEQDLWEQALKKAKSEGRTLAASVRMLMKLWVDGQIKLSEYNLPE